MSNKQPISTFLGIAAAVLLATNSSGFGGGPCPTDINGDGVTNVLDLIDLLLAFGTDCCAQLDCDDGDPCTVDDCDPVLGCSNTPINCPPGEQCVAGMCVPLCGNGVVDPGEDCANCPQDVQCPPGEQCVVGECQPVVIKGCQQPDNLAHGGALTGFSTCTPGSAAGNESAFAIVDDFNIDVNQTLGHVKWWGIYVTQGAPNCDPTDPLNVAVRIFEINIYTDDADGADNIPFTLDDHCPGANLLNQISLVTSVVNTGRTVAGLPVFEFDLDLIAPIPLTPGCYHLSIRGRMDLVDPISDCIFGWQTAGDPPVIGNGRSHQQGDGVTCNLLLFAPWICPSDASLYDLAWCLSEPAGPLTPINLGNPERCLPPQP